MKIVGINVRFEKGYSDAEKADNIKMKEEKIYG